MASPPLQGGAEDIDKQIVLSKLMKDVYAQQYFDTTPSELTNEIFNLCIEKFLKLLPSLEKSILFASTLKNSEEATSAATKVKADLAQYVMNFYTHLEQKADSLELYLDHHILSIPPDKIIEVDKALITYKELVDALNSESSGDGQRLTEETTVDYLCKQLADKRQEFFEKRRKKFDTQCELQVIEENLGKLETLEDSMKSVLSNFDGSLRDFVLNLVTAVAGLRESTTVRQNSSS